MAHLGGQAKLTDAQRRVLERLAGLEYTSILWVYGQDRRAMRALCDKGLAGMVIADRYSMGAHITPAGRAALAAGGVG